MVWVISRSINIWRNWKTMFSKNQ